MCGQDLSFYSCALEVIAIAVSIIIFFAVFMPIAHTIVLYRYFLLCWGLFVKMLISMINL